MSSKAPRACSSLGCPDTTGRCETHRRERDALRRREKGTTSERGYGWKTWQKRRPLWLSKYPLCGGRPGGRRPVMSRCFERGLATQATHIDHVTPHHGNKQLFNDSENNWQSMCASCSGAKSASGL